MILLITINKRFLILLVLISVVKLLNAIINIAPPDSSCSKILLYDSCKKNNECSCYDNEIEIWDKAIKTVYDHMMYYSSKMYGGMFALFTLINISVISILFISIQKEINSKASQNDFNELEKKVISLLSTVDNIHKDMNVNRENFYLLEAEICRVQYVAMIANKRFDLAVIWGLRILLTESRRKDMRCDIIKAYLENIDDLIKCELHNKIDNIYDISEFYNQIIEYIHILREPYFQINFKKLSDDITDNILQVLKTYNKNE